VGFLLLNWGARRSTGWAMLIAIFSGVYGLLLGSFANVVIHRVPRGESIARPRSGCPSCGAQIAARDNVPLLSWLLLRGRCRQCGDSISARYPAVEVATAALFVLMGWTIGWTWELPGFLFFSWALMALSVIDIDTHRLPNALLYPCTGVSIVLLAGAGILDGDRRSLIESAAGGALGFAVMLVVWFVAKGGLGYGDVRLSGYLGLHLGYLTLGHVPLGLFVGFFAGAVGGAVLMVVKGRGRKHKVAFGPYLALGALVAVIWGQPLIDLYLGR
jgi:leader peptidase (prepilin peptidase) / N-methyltransferase